jgi:predicted acylesterase/phospholipase RssA
MTVPLFLVDDETAALLGKRLGAAQLVHRNPDGAGWLVTEHTKQSAEAAPPGRMTSWSAPLRGIERLVARRLQFSHYSPDAARWYAATSRLILGWNASVAAPLLEGVAREATLWLYARPDLQLEYMGRGRFLNKARLPCAEDDLVYLDTAGGRRSYAFRAIRGSVGQVDERTARVRGLLRERQEWLADPEARIVLSLGGGGYRLFAALQAIKIIEQMLAGDRSKVHEVWGSSGGALLGYVFAKGLDLSVIERLAFDLYHGRSKDVAGIHLRSLLHFGGRMVSDLVRGRIGAPELGSWVESVDPSDGVVDRQPTQIPYYAMVSNTRWRHPVAFADPAHISEHCRDILIPCNSREATAASMSVPFLFRPLRGVRGFEEDSWFDGSIVDENPVMLPFVKWLRDRKAAPQSTPKRLKIILVNLNMRMSESTVLADLGRRSGGMLHKAMEVVDLLLDSKTHALIRTLTEVDDVEIMTATLTLGSLNFITRAAIPAAIRSGQLFEGWKLDLHTRGRTLG